MIFELADKDMIFLLGLFILWIGGTAMLSIGSITTFGYTLQKGHTYICSECGKSIPKNHHHTYEECQEHKKPVYPDHRLFYGSKKYWKAPEWRNLRR